MLVNWWNSTAADGEQKVLIYFTELHHHCLCDFKEAQVFLIILFAHMINLHLKWFAKVTFIICVKK